MGDIAFPVPVELTSGEEDFDAVLLVTEGLDDWVASGLAGESTEAVLVFGQADHVESLLA